MSSPEISFELPDEASVLSPVSSLIECNKPANRSLNISCNNLEKLFKLKLGQNGTRALHGAIFGVSIYFLIKFVLDPFVKRIEGHEVVYEDKGNTPHPTNN